MVAVQPLKISEILSGFKVSNVDYTYAERLRYFGLSYFLQYKCL
jgi:hypothetical protein